MLETGENGEMNIRKQIFSSSVTVDLRRSLKLASQERRLEIINILVQFFSPCVGSLPVFP